MTSASPSIAEVFDEFLAEQQQRLAAKTFGNYVTIVSLFRDCLNGYGHQSLDDDDERARFEAAFDDDEDAFVHLFGPEKIAENLGEFLGYFMVHKVVSGAELLRAAGTVTKKLAKWLGEHGYLDSTAVAIAATRGADAARDLPKADRLASLLYEATRTTNVDIDALSDGDYVDDYLEITRVEPGKLWFGGIGPVKVSTAASDLAQVGWSVNVELARAGKSWRILESGSVYP